MGVALLTSAWFALGAGAGCARAALPNPMPIEPRSYEPVYEASIEVLRDAGFELARREYRFGLVTTEPKGSPTIFEFWQRDNTTLGQAARSTVSDLRRNVRIELTPLTVDEPASGAPDATEDADDAGAEPVSPAMEGAAQRYAVRVEVTKQRQQVPVRRLTGAVETGVFSRLAAVPGEWAARGISARYWEPIGRDHHLEQRLLRRILRRASVTDTPEHRGRAEPSNETAATSSWPHGPGTSDKPGKTNRRVAAPPEVEAGVDPPALARKRKSIE